MLNVERWSFDVFLFRKNVSSVLVASILLIFSSSCLLGADQKPPLVNEQAKAANVDQAAEKAMKYLIGQQRPDGAITAQGSAVAMTSLAIMGMASVGHQPSDPSDEGKAMRAALAFVLQAKWQDPDGYFGRVDNSRMYGHGIITLMLAEMLGQGMDDEQDKLILTRLRKGLDLILKAQKQPKRDPAMKGGWRYTPDSAESDMSVSCWQTMALRAAYNKGLDVPEQAIKDAVEYIRRSYHSPRDAAGKPLNTVSGFTYLPQPNGTPTFSTAAEGLLAMQVCGEYDSPEVAGASELLTRIPPGGEWFYYGMYYYAQGMYQRGGDYAEEAKKRVPDALLPNQLADGGWSPVFDGEKAGRVYATSLSLLSLSIQWHYLPIYQR